MFSASLKATLIAFVLAASSVAAGPALSLSVSGPSEVSDVSSLSLTTTITNTGDESLTLLNDPRGTLNKFPTNSFGIVHDESGKAPEFTGAKVKYVPQTVIANGKADSFTTLTPGASVAVVHDLAGTYNFSTTGTGSYTFEPSRLFHYVDPETKQAVPIVAESESAHTSNFLSGSKLASPSSSVFKSSGSALSKRASFVGCSSTRQSQLNNAASAAQSYAASANSYASSHTSSTARYTTWFGTYTSSRHSTVASHFSNLNGNTYSSYTYDCSTCDMEAYAYVFPDDFGRVYLCSDFWSAPNTGTDSKGGTLIHESSHFTRNGGTDDFAYGQNAAKSLAQSNPANAVFNADSHEYFAENNPAQS